LYPYFHGISSPVVYDSIGYKKDSFLG